MNVQAGPQVHRNAGTQGVVVPMASDPLAGHPAAFGPAASLDFPQGAQDAVRKARRTEINNMTSCTASHNCSLIRLVIADHWNAAGQCLDRLGG